MGAGTTWFHFARAHEVVVLDKNLKESKSLTPQPGKTPFI
jgi:hypothetical protein